MSSIGVSRIDLRQRNRPAIDVRLAPDLPGQGAGVGKGAPAAYFDRFDANVALYVDAIENRVRVLAPV